MILRRSLYCIVLVTILVFSCEKENQGTLFFYSNGEDFVRDGFVEKNGWHITFSEVLVNITNVRAYNPHDKTLSEKLPNSYWIDLVGEKNNQKYPVLDTIKNVKTGNYQSLQFQLQRKKVGLNNNY